MQLASQNIDCLHTGKLEISFLLIIPGFLVGCIPGRKFGCPGTAQGRAAGSVVGWGRKEKRLLAMWQTHTSGSWLFSEWKERGRGMAALEPAGKEGSMPKPSSAQWSWV